MKVKELFENTGEIPSFEIVIIPTTYMSAYGLYIKAFDDLEAICEKNGLIDYKVSYNGQINIHANIPNYQVLQKVNKIYEECTSLIESFGPDNQIIQYSLNKISSSYPPAFPIIMENDSFFEVNIQLNEPTDFKDVGTLIGNTVDLYFRGCKNITSFIKLIKMENVTNIVFKDSNINDHVSNILEIYIKNKNKNVLQCQKELIQNGFKEYAK